MERTLVRDLKNLIGQKVQVCGWINTLRDQKRMQFVVVRDHTGLVQAVNEKAENALTAEISRVTTESAVMITGKVVENDAVKLGGIELVVETFEIANLAETPLPLLPGSGDEQRQDWRFLDLRDPKRNAIFRIQTELERAMRQFWAENDFVEFHTPKLMGSPSESGAELFTLEYFGGKAYLAQSPQFYKQYAIASGYNRMFEIGPVFRANPSFTSRHDTEFMSVDLELAWITSHEDVMDMEERWLAYVLGRIQASHGKLIKELFGQDIIVPTFPFPRVTMTEAYDIVHATGYEIPRASKGDLDPEAERRLGAEIKKKFGHEFVFVTDYPTSVRPFYHMRHPDNPSLTRSFDLLWKGLEVTTGAQREHRYDVLMRQVAEKGLTGEGMRHYLDCFRYGMPPHGGFGFGLSRSLMLMLGLPNVREVTYLYRGPNRLAP